MWGCEKLVFREPCIPVVEASDRQIDIKSKPKRFKANRVRDPRKFRSLEEFNEKWLNLVEGDASKSGQEKGGPKWEPKSMKMTFQVAEVSKPLVAVCRLVEKGNRVCFGPGAHDNFIANEGSGRKLPIYPDGKGSYEMKLQSSKGGQVVVKVDSAADESVCPQGWFKEFGTDVPKERMRFRGANGAVIKHLGERSIMVVSPFYGRDTKKWP